MGLRDGLGFEEVNQEVTSTAVISGTNIYATAAMECMDLSAGSGLDAQTCDISDSLTLSAGSPYGQGVVIQLLARTNISGGMFVSASGNLAIAAAASTKVPLGVAKPGTNVASGGQVNIITHGIVPVVAEGTIAVGAPAMMGAGAALNCVVAATAASGARVYSVLDAAGSEGTVFILL